MILKVIKRSAIFLTLTVLTQVGGLIYLLYLLLKKPFKKFTKKQFHFPLRIFLFCSLYLVFTFLVIPPIAQQFGRVPMPYLTTQKTKIKPLNFLTVLLNRHYVKPVLKQQMLLVANDLQKEFPTIEMIYLDANFPFMNGFPLLPHLSHDDGKKLDISFVYKDSQTGELLNDNPSWIGYGVYDVPQKKELNQPNICRKKGYWQYSILEQITPQYQKDKVVVDQQKTKRLLQLLARNKAIKKIFIEPHLKTRWGLEGYSKIRYHGCQAVRHDDHIHVQL